MSTKPKPSAEPTSAAAVQKWIGKHTRSADRFAHIADKYEPHRKQHGCYDVYPSSNGALLGALAAAAKPRRLLEVGCGLGYSALWLTYGAGPRASLETIEKSKEHARISIDHFKAEGLQKRIKVLLGESASVLPKLKGKYDLVYFDTDPGESLTALEHSKRLLRRGGILLSANLFLGQHAPDMPGLEKMAQYRLQILDARQWLTAFMDDGTAISVRV
jgi:predicted O-methyltransferase YrrM